MRQIGYFGLMIAAGTAGASVLASPAVPASYAVRMTIAADGRTLGTPVIVLREGITGMITVDGPDGYKAEVKVRGAAYRGEAGADVETRISRPQAGTWVVLGTPRLLVPLAKPANMQIGQEGSPPTLALGVTVTRTTD